MQPSKELVTTIAAMFREIWDNRLKRFEAKWKDQKHALSSLSAKINTLTDRLIDTTSPALIKNYESKLEAMETEKALIAENMQKKPDMSQSFDKSFRTALEFLAPPLKLWASENPDHRRTLLKLVFAAPLPYVRNQGFRTAKTTSPFKALADIQDGESEMAERVSA